MTPEMERLLRALGHDPTVHTAERLDRVWAPGLLVRDADGGTVSFYTDKALRRRRNDPDFLQAWGDAGSAG